MPGSRLRSTSSHSRVVSSPDMTISPLVSHRTDTTLSPLLLKRTRNRGPVRDKLNQTIVLHGTTSVVLSSCTGYTYTQYCILYKQAILINDSPCQARDIIILSCAWQIQPCPTQDNIANVHAVCIIQHRDLQLSNTGHILCTVFVLHTTLMLQHKTDCPARGQVLKCLSCTRQLCCSTRQIVQHGTTAVLHGTTHLEHLTLNRSASKRTTWIPLFWSRTAGLTALFLVVGIISICGTIV